MNSKITYHKVGDYYIPDLYLEKEEYKKIMAFLSEKKTFYLHPNLYDSVFHSADLKQTEFCL